MCYCKHIVQNQAPGSLKFKTTITPTEVDMCFNLSGKLHSPVFSWSAFEGQWSGCMYDVWQCVPCVQQCTHLRKSINWYTEQYTYFSAVYRVHWVAPHEVRWQAAKHKRSNTCMHLCKGKLNTQSGRQQIQRTNLPLSETGMRQFVLSNYIAYKCFTLNSNLRKGLLMNGFVKFRFVIPIEKLFILKETCNAIYRVYKIRCNRWTLLMVLPEP